jgi:hypothetical protein
MSLSVILLGVSQFSNTLPLLTISYINYETLRSHNDKIMIFETDISRILIGLKTYDIGERLYRWLDSAFEFGACSAIALSEH